MKTVNQLTALGLMIGGLCSTAFAQTDLFYPEARTIDGLKSSSEVIQVLSQNDSISDIQLIGINATALQAKNKALSLNFAKDLTLTTNQTQTYRIDDESYAWVGEIDLG